jgi:hypothetical protein
LMDLIRAREEMGKTTLGPYAHPCRLSGH